MRKLYHFLIILSFFTFHHSTKGQIINTVAGNGHRFYTPEGVLSSDAELGLVGGVAFDKEGNYYISSLLSSKVYKVEANTGIITTLAGTGFPGYSGDGGPATSAQLRYPRGVAVDASGNVYIADYNNNRIRKVDASTGLIETVAGTGELGTNEGDGPASSANLYQPEHLAIDASGNLYFTESDRRIRKLNTSTGIITTVSDKPVYSLAIDASDNLYYAYAHTIRKLDTSTGLITTVAGTGTYGYSGDGGPATSAQLNGPRGVAIDATGNLYIVDHGNNHIRKVDASTGIITTFAGNTLCPSKNDPDASSKLCSPKEIAQDPSGNLYISESNGHRVLKVDISSGLITTVAGTGSEGYGSDDVAATSTQISYPYSIVSDTEGNLYISDYNNHRIRRVDASSGLITTVAGSGTYGFSGDGGPATSAQLKYPRGIAIDASGNLYIADSENHRIRKVEASSGLITTIAGSSNVYGFSGDGGPATSALLYEPHDVAVDATGNLYIADSRNDRIRKVDALTQIITTVAGNGEEYGKGVDDVQATSTGMSFPQGIAVDVAGNFYFSDYYNYSIRKVDITTGLITTVAGFTDFYPEYMGDGGAATSAKLYNPMGITIDQLGNLYIADHANHCVRRVDAESGIISTVAGTGEEGYNGDDQLAIVSKLYRPLDVATDASGNLYITDTDNHRVRKVSADTNAPKDYSVSINDTVINAVTNFKFSIYNAELKAIYNYSVSSDTGEVPLSGSGLINDDNEQEVYVDVSSLPDGHLTLEVTLTDGFGNKGAIDTETVLKETTLPTVLTQDATLILDNNGVGEINISAIDNGSFDLSGIDSLILDRTTFNCSDVGEQIVTLTVRDKYGNTNSKTATVTIQENIAPTADLVELPVIQSTCQVSIQSYPSATDICSGTVWGTTTDPLMYDEPGSYMITWSFEDGNGNTTTQTQQVIIEEDVIAPVADVATLPATQAECSVTISDIPTATDNCSGKLEATTTDPLFYTEQGTYTVQWVYYDDNGNEATQMQTVIVEDKTAPVADVAELPRLTGECSVSVIETPTATDNCSGTITATTTDPLTYAEQGEYMISWTYADRNGNESIQTQTVIVKDENAPTFTCMSDVETNEATVSGLAIKDASDDCNEVTVSYELTGATTASGTGDASQETFNEGVTTVTYTVADANGNSLACSFDVSYTRILSVTNESLSAVALYPNPSINSTVTVELTKGYSEIRIVNLSGKQVYLKRGVSEPKVSIDVSQLPRGMYFVQLRGIAGDQMLKLFVQR